ncbi:sensor domain-containing protein [Mycobacterium colombiense]|uniref:sensor domain-containing protein n=1 Tax=Mycobacterium colombiense TaxID=339268 RepID=UPI002009F0DA|nr:sensor domain-containing protein [Mycobacterium colombiense]MCK8647271.1 sensor domain-containing protein [Mycobacterium colombiense]
MLATLSVVFAFVFAPAGLILGHLALAQIRRSGERGRDRALVGVTLSYVFITAAVVALIVAAVMPDTTPARVAAPATTPRSSIATTTPPPPPTVAPADVDGLLANVEDVKNITGNPAMKAGGTVHQPTPDPGRGRIDRTDCWAVMEAGAPEAYDVPAIAGFAGSGFADSHDLYHRWGVGQTVATFHDAAAAQTQLNKLLSILRGCGGSTMNATWPNGSTYPVPMEPPVDAGNGITTMAHVPQLPIRMFCSQALVAKANVVVQVGTCSNDGPDPSQRTALAVTNLILGRIPG